MNVGACVWPLPQLSFRRGCFGFTDRHILESEGSSGLSDNEPILAQRGRTTFEQRTLFALINVFPEHGFLPRTVRSVERGRGSELSLSGEPECLSSQKECSADVQNTQASKRQPADAGHSSPASKGGASWAVSVKSALENLTRPLLAYHAKPGHICGQSD